VSVLHKSFCHEIHKHILHRAVFRIDHPLFDMIADEVELNINVFRLGVVRWVLRERNGTLVVAKERPWHILQHSKIS